MLIFFSRTQRHLSFKQSLNVKFHPKVSFTMLHTLEPTGLCLEVLGGFFQIDSVNCQFSGCNGTCHRLPTAVWNFIAFQVYCICSTRRFELFSQTSTFKVTTKIEKFIEEAGKFQKLAGRIKLVFHLHFQNCTVPFKIVFLIINHYFITSLPIII